MCPPTLSSQTATNTDDDGIGNGHRAGGSSFLSEAMKTADTIRRILLENNDPVERNLVAPPGTVQGVGALICTGILLSPLRSAILKSVAAKTATSRGGVAAAVMPKQNKKDTADGAGPSNSFRNFLDLIVTPAMAVVAAQVGLVVGTLYGSGYYFRRVAADDAKADGTGISNDVMDKICHEFLKSPSSSSSSTDTTFGSNAAATDGSNSSSHTSVTPLGVTAGMGDRGFSSSYPRWDPRARTLEGFYQALERCRRRNI